MQQEVRSTTGMSLGEVSIWWLAIICTCGLAYPFYRARKRKADRTTVTVISGDVRMRNHP